MEISTQNDVSQKDSRSEDKWVENPNSKTHKKLLRGSVFCCQWWQKKKCNADVV